MEFKRPEGSPYPIVLSTFRVKVKDSDEYEEFEIRDLTEEYFDRAVVFIVENHAKGAVLHRAANTLSGESGLQRVSDSYRKVFEEKISLICFKKGSDEIVGLNALCYRTRDSLFASTVSSFDVCRTLLIDCDILDVR
jgi:hypothetical protein